MEGKHVPNSLVIDNISGTTYHAEQHYVQFANSTAPKCVLTAFLILFYNVLHRALLGNSHSHRIPSFGLSAREKLTNGNGNGNSSNWNGNGIFYR